MSHLTGTERTQLNIVFYDKLIGMGGQPFLKEIAYLTGFFVNISLGRRQLRDISEKLKGFQIEECHGSDRPILDRIF